MDQEPKPQQCIFDPKRRLVYIRWQDDHESLIPLARVRANCPCIECRELRNNSDPLRTLPPDQAQPSTEPAGVEELGNHAIQIIWRDGHRAGLYGWALLRSLCPCPACEPGQG